MRFFQLSAAAFCASCRDSSRRSGSTASRIQLKSSSNDEATTGSANNKYDRLLDWLRNDIDGAIISDKICLQPSTNGGGYGAFLTQAVETDELLFTIPREACLTLEDAVADDDVGLLLTKLMEKAGPGGNTVALAGYLAKERLESLKQSDNDSSDSEDDDEFWTYAPYLDPLPWERGVNNQEHILYWSDEEVEELLTDTMCYGEAIALRKEVALAVSVLDKIVGTNKPTASGFQLPWEKNNDGPKEPSKDLADAVKAAFVCLLTRSFQDGDTDEEKLVPLLDMLQHSKEPNVSHVMRKDDKSVQVRARIPIEKGGELLNQYRSELEENMPYHRFFTRFGFVPGMDDSLGLLKQKSPIFYAQIAEV